MTGPNALYVQRSWDPERAFREGVADEPIDQGRGGAGLHQGCKGLPSVLLHFFRGSAWRERGMSRPHPIFPCFFILFIIIIIVVITVMVFEPFVHIRMVLSPHINSKAS